MRVLNQWRVQGEVMIACISFENLWIHHCNLLHVTDFFLRPVLNTEINKINRCFNNYHIASGVSKVLLVEMNNEEGSCEMRSDKRKRSS